MADFEKYTGLKVKKGDKSVKVGKSKIIFHHADELAGVVQNINLGFFFIEQAEEFDNDEVFQKLRGRLRRADCEHTNGHNWIWRTWKNAPPSKEYSLVEAKTFDNAAHLPEGFLKDMATMKEESPAHYRRYILNSWEDVDTDDRCIPYAAIMDAIDHDIFYLNLPRKVVAVDPAEFGADKTVIMCLEEGRIIDMEVSSKQEPMVTAGKCIKMMKLHGATLIGLDSIGIGSGIRSRISELGYEAIGVNVGEKSSDPEKYKNLKAEIWMNAQNMFRERKVSIPDQQDLIEDLAAVRYQVNSRGQVQLETKDKTKQRLGRSPDYGDCLVIGLHILDAAEQVPVFEEDEDDMVANSYTTETVF